MPRETTHTHIGYTEIRRPSRAADLATNPLTQIWLVVPELAPWLLRVDFVVYQNDNGGHDYEYRGSGLDGRELTLWEAQEELDPTPDTVEHVLEKNRDGYKRIAEHFLRAGSGTPRHVAYAEAAAVRAAMLGQNPERQRELVRERFQAAGGRQGIVPELERDYDVHRSTIYRWVNDTRTGPVATA